MSEFFTPDRDQAIPITPVTRARLPAWLKEHQHYRPWLDAIGFKAEPGSFAFLAGNEGQVARVLAAPVEGESIWAFAGLPMSLPEGHYVFQTQPDASPTDVALGWALGAYAFTRYK